MRAKVLMTKIFSLCFVTFVFATCPYVQAQSGKIPRIGYVLGSGDAKNPGLPLEAFRQGLRDLGYLEEKNILFELRSAEGKIERIPSLVDELVQLKVDVLVVLTIASIRAAKLATKTIPIVMLTTVDPVAAGLVNSLARPGENITGLTTLTRELGGKRLELFKESIPRITRIGVLGDADGQVLPIALKEYEAAASALGIQIQSIGVRGPSPDLLGAFQAAAKSRVDAFITVSVPLLSRYRKQIAELMIKNRIPSMCEESSYVEAGCLMSYATNRMEQLKRGAAYVDKILKGAKPADLPIEQPTKFEFVINLKSAKQIGVTIPPNVVVRADRVIK